MASIQGGKLGFGSNKCQSTDLRQCMRGPAVAWFAIIVESILTDPSIIKVSACFRASQSVHRKPKGDNRSNKEHSLKNLDNEVLWFCAYLVPEGANR
jgi:hypothetical protein